MYIYTKSECCCIRGTREMEELVVHGRDTSCEWATVERRRLFSVLLTIKEGVGRSLLLQTVPNCAMELKEKREGMAQMDGNEVMGTCNNQLGVRQVRPGMGGIMVRA